MLILANTTDKIQLVTSSAAAIDVHVSYADLNSGAVTPNRQNTNISSATTTDICAAPAASTVRNVKTINVRNRDAALSCNVTVIYNANGTTAEMHKVTLIPGAVLEYVEGVGFFTISANIAALSNASTSSQTPFSSDTYLSGSGIAIPANLPIVGTTYKLTFDITKTAAGTATPIVSIRIGTNESTADTARCTFTFGAGTAAADEGIFDCICTFRTVGSGTSAVLQGIAELKHQLASTGLTSTGTAGYAELGSTSSGFDSTPSNLFIGASYNGGASAAHTIQLVRAELDAS